jgi:protein phosphatase
MTINVVYDAYLADPTIAGMKTGIERANRDVIRDAADNPDRFGMGTTIIAVATTEDADGKRVPTMFNVGDSRCYQLRDGAIRQLSDDHSVAEEWVRMGRLTLEEAKEHPRRHQLTRAIGVENNIAIDVLSINAMAGDRLILCSDGLSNEVSNDDIARLASDGDSLESCVAALIGAAKAAGGKDNISVAIIEFDEVSVTASPVKETASNAAPPVSAASSSTKPLQRRRRRQFGWRAYAYGGAFVGIVIGFFVIMHWYAYSSYYLGNDNGTVAVYEGQAPNGVLWFKPVKVLDTTYPMTQLRTSDIAAIDNTITEPSLTAALHYAQYLHTAWTMSQATTGTTSTTTSSVTTTTAKG